MIAITQDDLRNVPIAYNLSLGRLCFLTNGKAKQQKQQRTNRSYKK